MALPCSSTLAGSAPKASSQSGWTPPIDDLKSATWRAFRPIEKMLVLFFDLGQAREDGKSRFLWHGERPSR
jgi:hypothetical protein